MKIALVIERMDVGRGGRETSTAQVAGGLARAGHEVTIVCQEGKAVEAGVGLAALGGRGVGRAGRLRNFVTDVEEFLAGERQDIVHAMLPLGAADVYQLRGGTLRGQEEASLRRRPAVLRPLVRQVRRLNPHRREMARLERVMVANGRTVWLAVSEMVAQECRAHYGLSGDRLRVVYNAVDLPAGAQAHREAWRQEVRARLNISPQETVFIVVAKNYELKGVAQTIEAFAQWRDKGPAGRGGRLLVVGKGPEEAEGYQRHAGVRAVGSAVSFIPADNEIFRWYAAADVNVLLSWYDPCSRVVLEATRYGVPSITTTFNGAAEILAGGAGVVVASPTDRRAVVAAMEKLADGAVRQRMSEQCLAVSGHLGMDRHVQGLLKVYEEIVSRRG